MRFSFSNAAKRLSAIAVLAALPGCVGIYDNSERFLNEPPAGMSEVEVIKTYGTPTFASESGTAKVLTYKVRDTKYIVLFGQYEGYDLVIVLKDGKVVETQKVPLGKAFALFQPWPWLVE